MHQNKNAQEEITVYILILNQGRIQAQETHLSYYMYDIWIPHNILTPWIVFASYTISYFRQIFIFKKATHDIFFI